MKANLILNVDGCIAVCFVNMVRSCGAFSALDADAMVKYGGFIVFVLQPIVLVAWAAATW